jgi:DNA-binding response OmpR family regulator
MAKKILIVEDDAVMREAVGEYMKEEGFEIVYASDGEEGVNLAKEKIPDLILLDIILPKKDGYEVIKDIKADEKAKKIPIVLLTNLGSLSDVDKAINMGATTYLVKADYKLEEVAKKVKEILGM